MSKQSIIRFSAFASFIIASSASVAMAETTPTRAGVQQSTLKRANDDLVRQLRPSGLKQHGQNISRIANRGYVDFMATIKAPGHRR